ncbi:MAG: hypothetical protein EOP85_14800 [Verrucomicrobiaceae bacterium]|nr:MAG: hypothetical protein EOP85_14800 [Verrucomicrobiaceae bacterium]
MKYPVKYSRNPDPREIREGDLVWWNEGTCAGFVLEVMEDRESYEAWGLDEPSVALTNLHPLEANELKHPQRIGSVTTGATVVYPERSLEDDAVEPLSADERLELETAMATGRNRVAAENRDLPICVSMARNNTGNGWDWILHFVNADCVTLDSAVVPAKGPDVLD